MKTHRYLQLALAAVAVFVILRVVGFSSGALPLLLVVIACPLMMFFMMRNMGGMDHSNHTDRSDNSKLTDHDPKHRG